MKSVIPLLAVVRLTKDKVRPVMVYYELNLIIESYTGDDEIAICTDKVPKRKQVKSELKDVDLKSALICRFMSPRTCGSIRLSGLMASIMP